MTATTTDISGSVEKSVKLTINGKEVSVNEGATVKDAAEQAGVSIPTLCWAKNLTPANVCRLCVVELEGSRTLIPSCARTAEDGMVVHTDSERVHHSRKMVLEFLASGTDLSQAPDLLEHMETYGADANRFGEHAEKIQEPIRIQDDLYIRDYSRCVLCYKCVQACGDDAQHTYAISLSERGFSARISTEFDATLPNSACVYCGNCVDVCPTNALQFKGEFDIRQAGDWRPDDQSVSRTVCSYCGVGCNLEMHVQDNTIFKVTSPADHDVTHGHLCIKGRFGWQYVQPNISKRSS